MEVVIDGRRGWGSGDARTLGAVLDALRSSIGGRTVVQLVLDGEDLTRERREELARRSVGDFSLLEVRTVDPVAFGREAIRGIATHMRNLERAHEEAARALEAVEYGKATERLWECYNGWDTLSRAVRDVAAVAGLELGKIGPRGSTGTDLVCRLNQTLTRFRSAMDFPDIVRLSKVAGHELRPELASWRALLDALAQQVEGRKPK